MSLATNKPNSIKLKAFKAAFPHTLPIFAGFSFLGFAYGIYMNVSGFSVWYPFFMSITIFGGSLEFVAVSMLLSAFAPVQALILTILIQARHLFYGLSMLERFKAMGWKKFYLIFGMCDETFSINFTARIPEDVDKGWFMLFVTILNHSYWVLGSTFGGLIGSFVHFETKGLDFVMTAMFIVIFMEQWFKENQHITALIGLVSSVTCLIVFGPQSFMIPTMICILILLSVLKKPIEISGGLK